MSYPQGYLYQPPGSLALYSCPLAAPRSEELVRSSSGSAFSPYPGSAAFTASASGFSSPLPYSTDPATGFPSYMVNSLFRFRPQASLWSLAEIATSDPKQQQQQQQNCPPGVGLLTSTASSASPTGAVYPATSILGRPLYYTSPFYSNYTNYGNFSPLQGQGILRYNSSGEGLLHKQSGEPLLKTNPNQTEQHFRASNAESKKEKWSEFLRHNSQSGLDELLID
uniref:Iroquois homeobox 2a n=1 Tax=Sinocyclocheilus rhinocerous TaxID=307959 RepID=A0A673IIU6_9TELE